MTREQILTDEFLRPARPGLRKLSAGVLALARKLQIGFALTPGERAALPAEEAARDMVAFAWLLDARHSLAAIRAGAAMGRARFAAEILDDYEFALDVAFLKLVEAEIADTGRAIDAAAFIVAEKPGDTSGAAPPGNS